MRPDNRDDAMESPGPAGSEVSLSVRLNDEGIDLTNDEGKVSYRFTLSDGRLEGLHLWSKSKGLFDRTALIAAQ